MPSPRKPKPDAPKQKERRYVATKTELARRIQVSRPTLDVLFRLADHPENHSEGEAKFDVQRWLKFAAENNYGRDRPALSAKDQSLIERNSIKAKREAFLLEREMGEYFPRREVNTHIDTANSIVVRELRKAFGQELPPRQEGLSALEIKKMNLGRLDKIFQHLPKHLKNVAGHD